MESKPLYKSLTVIAGGAFVLLGYLETQGILPAGSLTAAQAAQDQAISALSQVVDALQALAAFGGVVGLRRAIG